MNLPKYEEITEGYELPSLTKEPITQLQLIRYAGASGDFNQIHTVPDYAKEAGLPGTITHGMLVMGILGQMVSDFAGVKNVKSFSVSFKSMSKPGDVLTAKGNVKRKYENENGKFVDCKVFVEDQNKDVKVDGKVTLKF
jgi:acyl dehydratase